METSKPPKHLVLAAVLSASLTSVLSIVYAVLCTIALIYYAKCEVGNPETTSGSEFFFNVLYRQYFQNEECRYSVHWEGLTQAYTIYTLTCATLATSILCFVASLSLISSVREKQMWPYMHVIIYTYIGMYIASVAVDITLAVHFGMDYSFITDNLNASSAGLQMNYLRDMIRLGAFCLMSISLKGFVAHVVNIVMIILLVHYLIQYTDSQEPKHPIHTLGALNGYGTMYSLRAFKRMEENQSLHSDSFLNQPMSSQINFAYTKDEPRSSPSPANKEMTDYLSRMFERSESWQSGSVPVGSSKPFSYLQERSRQSDIRPSAVRPSDGRLSAVRPSDGRPLVRPLDGRPLAVRPPVPPTDRPVNIPAPDYSPHNQRRFNSLYM